MRTFCLRETTRADTAFPAIALRPDETLGATALTRTAEKDAMADILE